MPYKNKKDYLEYQMKFRKKRRDQNLCTFCGIKLNEENVNLHVCIKCRRMKLQTTRAFQRKMIARGICSECYKNPIDCQRSERYCTHCLDMKNSALKKRNAKLKDQVFHTYGGYRCNCCGEIRKTMLQLDHIKNDGYKYRKIQGTGYRLYHWIVQNNFPSDFQILCANCNHSKRINHGICEHQTEKQNLIKEAEKIVDMERVLS